MDSYWFCKVQKLWYYATLEWFKLLSFHLSR